VEDPKGGVFGLTKGLSSRYAGRVINSPLAEATIAGLASGLCQKGFFPIFELQFIDFVGTAFNQIANQIATLRWRTNGGYKCPMIIYAPCGGYISGGGPWHSQTNESWFAHIPGLKIYMPSDANDVSDMLHSAAYGDDPVLFLLPKNLFQKKFPLRDAVQFHLEKPAIRNHGQDVTVVTWGNCVDVACAAANAAGELNISVDLFDIRSIVPCDLTAIKQSVMKTGRLVIVHEDNKTCSFGHHVIGEIVSDPSVFSEMYHAPVLVSRDDVLIPFNRKQELSVLPDADDVVFAIKKVMGVI
jgi:2-oxoisovalerate dehydrogenase E1 component